MKYLDLTLPTPQANLACDEALLDWCEQGQEQEILRFWQSPEPFVVLGYANQVRREVRVESCEKHGIPVLRRCSGGGAVVQGHGCLNYSLILEIGRTDALASIPGTNRYIMQAHREVFQNLTGAEMVVSGHTDLVLDTRKFSGNAQRRRRRWLLFHGTFLLAFDLTLIERCLAMPSHQPTYRGDRGHLDFVRNVELPQTVVKAALRQRWNADLALTETPDTLTDQLVQDKYSRADWNLRI